MHKSGARFPAPWEGVGERMRRIGRPSDYAGNFVFITLCYLTSGPLSGIWCGFEICVGRFVVIGVDVYRTRLTSSVPRRDK